MNWVIRHATRFSLFAVFTILISLFMTESAHAICSRPNAPDTCFQLRAEGDNRTVLPAGLKRAPRPPVLAPSGAFGGGQFQTLDVSSPTYTSHEPESDEVTAPKQEQQDNCEYQVWKADAGRLGDMQYISDGQDGNVLLTYPIDYTVIDEPLSRERNKWSPADFTSLFRSEGRAINSNPENCQVPGRQGEWALLALTTKTVHVQCRQGKLVALGEPSAIEEVEDGDICQWKKMNGTWINQAGVRPMVVRAID